MLAPSLFSLFLSRHLSHPSCLSLLFVFCPSFKSHLFPAPSSLHPSLFQFLFSTLSCPIMIGSLLWAPPAVLRDTYSSHIHTVILATLRYLPSLVNLLAIAGRGAVATRGNGQRGVSDSLFGCQDRSFGVLRQGYSTDQRICRPEIAKPIACLSSRISAFFPPSPLI